MRSDGTSALGQDLVVGNSVRKQVTQRIPLEGESEMQTTPIESDRAFLSISDQIDELLSGLGLVRKTHKGSHSWTVSDGQHRNVIFIKLCHYGEGGLAWYRFGIRDGLANDGTKAISSDEFEVAPNWGKKFYGFEVTDSNQSLSHVKRAMATLPTTSE